MPPVVKRFSLLRRSSGLSRDEFSRHYRDVHGPLAAAQAGFRQFAFRYDQNHVETDLLGGGDPPYDGITVTYQVPRADYRRGFFQHPDYANVRPDEEFLFDLARTVSVLGTEASERAGSGGSKAIVICGNGRGAPAERCGTGPHEWPGLRGVVRNDLDPSSASALGSGSASVSFGHLWELWFDAPAVCTACLGDPSFRAALSPDGADRVLVALAVRELTIYRPES